MAPSPLQQRRTHNTLLFQKLLNLRDGASPFTLVLDTLEQSGNVVVGEFAGRAKLSKSKIIYISFTTLRKKVSFEHDIFISAIGKTLPTLRAEIISHLPAAPTTAGAVPGRTVLIIDSLNPLSATSPAQLPTFLSSLLLSQSISLLATYHTDIPLPHPPSSSSSTPHTHNHNPYAPTPLTTLLYLSTAILTISNFTTTITRKKARDKSLPEPLFGLEEGREGILFGLNPDTRRGGRDGREVVVKMEVRRKSGRGIVETFVLSSVSTSGPTLMRNTLGKGKASPGVGLVLLEEHPDYNTLPTNLSSDLSASADHAGEDEVLTTFNLNLTEKQRRDREGVVLPYFDAQKEGGALGAGEGGRILYEMGAEDREDFDDEEDEI